MEITSIGHGIEANRQVYSTIKAAIAVMIQQFLGKYFWVSVGLG